MINIGNRNSLVVSDIFPFAYALNTPDASLTEPVLLKDADVKLNIGERVDVFVFTNAEGTCLATKKDPLIKDKQFAGLTVTGSSTHGFFFDWGIEPDLYCPQKHAHTVLDEGKTYVCRLILDKQNKLIATTKIEQFLSTDSSGLSNNQAVSLMVYAETPLGYKCIVESKFMGLLYKNELIKNVRIGEQLQGFVKQIRSDGKLDLSLQLQTQQARLSLSQEILNDLAAHDGISTLTDKSSPKDIFARFNVSKGAYKKAIGSLYKDKLIRIEKDCLYLNKSDN